MTSDYVFRQRALESECLHNLYLNYKIVSGTVPKNKSNGVQAFEEYIISEGINENNGYESLSGNPHCKNRYVKMREKIMIPELIGPRIPNLKKIEKLFQKSKKKEMPTIEIDEARNEALKLQEFYSLYS